MRTQKSFLRRRRKENTTLKILRHKKTALLQAKHPMSSARAFFPEISHYVPNPQDFWGCFLAAFLTFLSVHRTRPTPFSPGKKPPPHLLALFILKQAQ